MRRMSSFASISSLVAMSLIGSNAAAEGVADLADKLANGKSGWQRAKAARALGGSNDDAAVKPLCAALGDDDASVKEAAAAALGKLGRPAGLPCLKSALSTEGAAKVKTQLQLSLSALDPGNSPPPPPGAGAKVYVAIEIANQTGRPDAEVDAMVRSSMQAKLLGLKGFAVAPPGETLDQGKKVVSGKRLKGYVLIVSVLAPVYSNNELTQAVSVSVASYPDREIKGALTPHVTQQNTPKKDPRAEVEMIRACAENAIEGFQKMAGK